MDKKNMVECIINEFAMQASCVMDANGIKHSDIRMVSSDKILLEYFNFSNKRVNIGDRKVYYSKGLLQKISNKAFYEVDGSVSNESDRVCKLINVFGEKYMNGENINGHLSRGAMDSTKRDMLLNSWNIRHLHLNDKVATTESEMVNNRSKWLLFFVEDGQSVYFLDVIVHPSGSGFSAYHFLEIANENGWMDKLGFYELKGAISLNINITDDEELYKLIHKGNINILIPVGDKIYSPKGITIAGNRLSEVMFLNRIRGDLYNLCKNADEFVKYVPDGVNSLKGILILKNAGEQLTFNIKI